MPQSFLAVDTETTGIDLYHGARPFFVTACDQDGNQTFWEWPVDPLTRVPRIPPGDVAEVQALLDSAEEVVCHNGKFDATALATIGVDFPWAKAHDTLLASHLLSSNTPHDLTSLGVVYLDRSILEFEKKLRLVVQRCRRYCRTNLRDWLVASDTTPGIPSAAGDSSWRCDYWLPKALADHDPDREDAGELSSVLEEYSNADSALTAELWPVFRDSLVKQDLWDIYTHRRKLLPIAQGMERNGLSVNLAEYRRLVERYFERSEYTERVCTGIASTFGYELTLPKSGRNASLHRFVFDVLNAPPLKLSEKTKEPSLDQDTRESLEKYFAPTTKEHVFFARLNEKTACDKALTNLDTYARYWKVLPDVPDWGVLHPWTNPTGTDTLRWSFSNPNQANISKREGYNLRYLFGPRPGRVWYSGDAQNIELRIPTFEAGETALMDVFLRPKDPPYYGSYHLVVFDVLHPEKFKQHGAEAKTVFESTWYQWVKNGNFAVIYGAQEAKADATYRVKGAYRMIRDRFPKIAELNDKMLKHARKHGYVETIPDREVHPRRGYPLLCSRAESGAVVPTTPLNYHVSGTAMQWMCKAMVRCQVALDAWKRQDGFDGWIAAQVHDELLFDFPQEGELDGTNVARIRDLKVLMERGGDDIGVPTPVSFERHATTWAEGEKLKL